MMASGRTSLRPLSCRRQSSFCFISCEDRRLGDDGDAGVDFHRALDGLDVVEFAHRLDVDLVFLEQLVGGLARGDVLVEADEFVLRQFLDGGLLAPGQRVVRRADEDELVLVKGDDFQLAVLHRERDEAEVHRVVQHVLIHEVRAAVFDADVHLRVFLQIQL